MLPGRTEGLQKIRVDETDERIAGSEKGMRKKNRVDEADERTKKGREANWLLQLHSLGDE